MSVISGHRMKTEDLHKPAIPVAYGHLILTVADKLGVPRSRMLDGLHIPDAVFASADARLSMLQANNLLYRGMKLTGNPGFGYEIGLHSSLTTHGFIGFGLLSNATLRTAADFGSRYLALRLPNLSLRVFTDGAHGVIEANETLALGAVRQCMFDLFLVGLWRMVPMLGAQLADARPQIELCFGHYQAMIETNRTLNLTRITEPTEAAVKHYADSLAVLPWLRHHDQTVRTVLDIGTGAGFPAVPLAILHANWSVVALDGTGKKIEFLESTCRALRLKNIAPIHAHSSQYETGRPFDLVLTRAVGALAKCLALAAPHLKKNGVMVAYKTPTALFEVAEAESLARRLGLEAMEPNSYELTGAHDRFQRVIVPYRYRS